MILQKVHLRLTLLCTGITAFIMLVMSLIYLHLSETQLFQNELYSFENDLHTMETNLEQQSIISMEWIAKMEAYGNYQLFLFDNGTPFLYNQLHDTPQNQKLLKKAQEAAEELELPSKKSSTILNRMDSVLLNASRQENDLIGMVYSTGSDSSLQIFVFSSLSHLHYQYIEQRIFFVLITVSATLLLFAFSYFFTKKLLKPIAENQEKQLQFVASASHELRTPLAVILCSAECCEYGASSDQHSFLRTIGEEGKRMSHLIDEMLYLSQSRDQQMRIHLEQVELDTLCLKGFESFEPLAARQGLTLSLDLPEHPIPSVTGDEEKLMQLLSILLSNALSYTPKGGSITIRLKTQGRAHLLSVEDTGIGITKEDQPHIFDRFYRTEKSRSTKGHFGLGLSIAYEIVTAHGGKIEVEDNTPNGSIFTVTL